MKHLGRLVAVGAASLAAMFILPGTATAVTTLTLVQEAAGTVGPQSTAAPCVIAGTQCQQPAGMGYNNYISTGAISSYNMYSTTPTATVLDGVQGTPYTVAQLEALGLGAFNIAIDVNTTAAAGEMLRLFEVIINGVVEYIYTTPDFNIGALSSNGNGFADFTLREVDLSSYADNATVLFHAVWDTASDGAESFFLVAVPFPVVGAGLPGLVLACGALLVLGRRRRQRLA